MDSLRREVEAAVPAMRRFARALVRDHSVDAADDMVQDALIAMLRADRPMRSPASLALYAILVDVHRSRVRGVGGARRGVGQAGQPATIDRQPHFGRATGTDFDVQALDALPLESREIVLLVVLEGLSYTAVAGVLGIPMPVLLARLARARAAMADAATRPSPVHKPLGAAHLRLVK